MTFLCELDLLKKVKVKGFYLDFFLNHFLIWFLFYSRIKAKKGGEYSVFNNKTTNKTNKERIFNT